MLKDGISALYGPEGVPRDLRIEDVRIVLPVDGRVIELLVSSKEFTLEAEQKGWSHYSEAPQWIIVFKRKVPA